MAYSGYGECGRGMVVGWFVGGAGEVMSPMGAPGIVKERVRKICYTFDMEKKALVKMLS